MQNQPRKGKKPQSNNISDWSILYGCKRIRVSEAIHTQKLDDGDLQDINTQNVPTPIVLLQTEVIIYVKTLNKGHHQPGSKLWDGNALDTGHKGLEREFWRQTHIMTNDQIIGNRRASHLTPHRLEYRNAQCLRCSGSRSTVSRFKIRDSTSF